MCVYRSDQPPVTPRERLENAVGNLQAAAIDLAFQTQAQCDLLSPLDDPRMAVIHESLMYLHKCKAEVTEALKGFPGGRA